jgi:S-adenosylmethionine hydrolase
MHYNNKNGGKMEKREKLEINNQTKVFFEAVFERDGYADKIVIEDSIGNLQIAVNVWTKCGQWKLKSADKVERTIARLIA